MSGSCRAQCLGCTVAGAAHRGVLAHAVHRDIGAEQSQPLLHLQVGPRWQQEETVKMDLHTLEHATCALVCLDYYDTSSVI